MNTWRWAIIWLVFLALLAVAAPWVANQRPLYCRIGGQAFYPAFQSPQSAFGQPDLDAARSKNNWYDLPYEKAVFPPIAFTAGVMDEQKPVPNALPPGALHPGMSGHHRHWLGTDRNGFDAAAGMVAGVRTSVFGGLTTMLCAMLIGVLLGSWAGFMGDDRLYVARGRLFMTIIGLFPAWFYAFAIPLLEAEGWRAGLVSSLVFVAIVWLFNLLGKWLSRWAPASVPVRIPADLLVMRLVEIFQSVPLLLVVIAVATLSGELFRAWWVLPTITGLFLWPEFARYLRAELLRIRTLDYVTAARALGLGEWRVLWRHALPNAIGPVVILFAVGMGQIILLLAALSFLGYSPDTRQCASWGGLLRAFRMDTSAWWLAVFPTLFIALTMLALHAIGRKWSEKRV